MRVSTCLWWGRKPHPANRPSALPQSRWRNYFSGHSPSSLAIHTPDRRAARAARPAMLWISRQPRCPPPVPGFASHGRYPDYSRRTWPAQRRRPMCSHLYQELPSHLRLFHRCEEEYEQWRIRRCYRIGDPRSLDAELRLLP